MKQEIIKKMNQDNQFTAKCKEPNLGRKWDFLLDFRVHELKTAVGITFEVTSLICDYNSSIFFASAFIITGVLYRCYTNIT
jgi:hypothetical protein